MTLMPSALPINFDRLLRGSAVESERLEVKAGWDPRTTGPQVLRTICAFANDYYEVNGGYIVLGVEERDGRPVLPPRGLTDEALAAGAKWIRANCRRLDPPYTPIITSGIVDGRPVLVVRAVASELRPHRAPGARGEPARYWVRLRAETVDAEQRGDLLRNLLQLTARVPWDDRPASGNETDDISPVRVEEHLRAVHSDLPDRPDRIDHHDLYRRMRLTMRVNDHEVPRNIALLLFSVEPTEWFPGAAIEVAHFAGEPSGDVLEEQVFPGSMIEKLRDCLNYLIRRSPSLSSKQEGPKRVRTWVAYPRQAIAELLVNAVIHRSYSPEVPDPIRVFLYPDRLVIGSHPGPVPELERSHFLPGAERPLTRCRNRRIAEFLKERGLAEGRLTGLDKVFRSMQANGSPPPEFDFDDGRHYFQVTLRAHPEFVALSALREAQLLRTLNRHEDAAKRIATAWRSQPASAPLAAEVIRLQLASGDIVGADLSLSRFCDANPGVSDLAEASALLKQASQAFLDEMSNHRDDTPPGTN